MNLAVNSRAERLKPFRLLPVIKTERLARDRMDFNRKLLQIAARFGFIPSKFYFNGKKIHSHVSKFRQGFWISALALSIVCGIYMNVTLLHVVLDRTHPLNYYHFGVHIIRGLTAFTFSYWAYKLFVAHREEHEILYAFIHTNPGKLPFSQFVELT